MGGGREEKLDREEVYRSLIQPVCSAKYYRLKGFSAKVRVSSGPQLRVTYPVTNKALTNSFPLLNYVEKPGPFTALLLKLAHTAGLY